MFSFLFSPLSPLWFFVDGYFYILRFSVYFWSEGCLCFVYCFVDGFFKYFLKINILLFIALFLEWMLFVCVLCPHRNPIIILLPVHLYIPTRSVLLFQFTFISPPDHYYYSSSPLCVILLYLPPRWLLTGCQLI